LGTTALFPQASPAQTTSFFCGISPEGVYTTYGKTDRGDIPIIRWVSNHFADSGYTPRQRCLEVSNRFQDYYQKGILKYITVGIRNRQPVVCISQSGFGCDQLLFTLKRGTDAARVVQRLNDFANGVAGTPPLFESAKSPGATQPETLAVDVEKLLQNAPIEAAKGSEQESPNPGRQGWGAMAEPARPLT
jgi:hypothetical protein